AHVGRAHAIATQPPAQRLGLGAAARGELDVGPTLEAALGVPQGLAVARQQEPPHAGAPIAARAARSRASVSSRPTSASTSKSGGEAVRPVTASRVSWARSTSLSPIDAGRSR